MSDGTSLPSFIHHEEDTSSNDIIIDAHYKKESFELAIKAAYPDFSGTGIESNTQTFLLSIVGENNPPVFLNEALDAEVTQEETLTYFFPKYEDSDQDDIFTEESFLLSGESLPDFILF